MNARTQENKPVIRVIALHPVLYNLELREDNELNLDNWLFLKLSTASRIGDIYGDADRKIYKLDQGIVLEVFAVVNCRHGTMQKECLLIFDAAIYKRSSLFRKSVIGNIKAEIGFDQHDDSIGRSRISVFLNKKFASLDRIGIAIQTISVRDP